MPAAPTTPPAEDEPQQNVARNDPGPAAVAAREIGTRDPGPTQIILQWRATRTQSQTHTYSPLPSANRARGGMEVEAYAPEAATSTGASVFSVAEVNSEPAIAAAAQTTGAAQTAVTMDEDESGGGDDIEDDSETSEEYQRPGETFADAERRRNFPPGAPTIRWPLTDFPASQLIVRRERK